MNNRSREEALKYHQRRIAKLMETTRVHNDTAFPVIDEATAHIVQHFNPPHIPETSRDHCLIIGVAYLGERRDDPAQQISAASFFMCGNTHQLSHTMADAMREDEEFAKCVFHAMEVFALHGPSEDKIVF